VYETDALAADVLKMLHPNTIIFTCVSELPMQLWQLPGLSMFTRFGFAPFASHIFHDVPEHHWAGDFIYDMYRRGAVRGLGYGYFAPDAYVNIAQFLATTLRLAGVDVQPTLTEPVGDHQWAWRYVNFGRSNNILANITPPGNIHVAADFADTTPISREAAFYILYRVFSRHNPQGWNRLAYANRISVDLPFMDQDEISDAYFSGIELLFQHGLLTGRPRAEADGIWLFPTENLQRAEMAMLLFNMVTPAGTIWAGIRTVQPRVASFTELDPRPVQVTSTRGATYSAEHQAFNHSGARQYSFTAPQSGLYVFDTIIPLTDDYSRVGYAPVLFLVTESATGGNPTFERVRPAWGSSNIFELESNRTYVVEAFGAAAQSYTKTVSRRNVYFATIYHYYDSGHRIRYLDVNVHQRFRTFDNIANRIFYELAGLHISTAQDGIVNFRSPMDRCRELRAFRYYPYIEIGIDDICDDEDLCGNCSHILEFARRVLWPQYFGGFEPGIVVPSIGTQDSPTITWIGNRVFAPASAIGREGERDYDRSFIWGSGWNNIFMLTRDNENNVLSVYIHELAHQFGARDHYCEPIYNQYGDEICVGGRYCSNANCDRHPNGRNPRPACCIMNTSRISNISERYAHELFCAGCANDIANFLTLPENINYFGRSA
jgi:hypothetical protein